MVKDRLREFRENVEKHGLDEDFSVGNHFAVVDMESNLMTDVLHKVNFIENGISELSELVQLINSLQQEMLGPLPDISTKLQLDETIIRIRQLGNGIRKHLNEMKQNQEWKSNARQRIIETQASILSKRFCDLMNQYYQLLVAYDEQCRAQITRQAEISGIKADEDEMGPLLDNDRLVLYPEIVNEQQTLEQMNTRHVDMMQLENAVRELHTMFFELADLVDRQDVYVSSIEQHIDETVRYSKELVQTIRFAKTQRRSAGKKEICLTVIIVSTVAILVVSFLKLLRIL